MRTCFESTTRRLRSGSLDGGPAASDTSPQASVHRFIGPSVDRPRRDTAFPRLRPGKDAVTGRRQAEGPLGGAMGGAMGRRPWSGVRPTSLRFG